MSTLASRITNGLACLVGQPIGGCWRAANMQMFEFGPRRRIVNRMGREVEVGQFQLHVQCRWRMVDQSRILFGRDDLSYPADKNTSIEEFDWDKQESRLDVLQRDWFASLQGSDLLVVGATGDDYGGFRISLEHHFALEAFPCDTLRDEYSEHWRLFSKGQQDSHFVVTGIGILGENVQT